MREKNITIVLSEFFLLDIYEICFVINIKKDICQFYIAAGHHHWNCGVHMSVLNNLINAIQ